MIIRKVGTHLYQGWPAEQAMGAAIYAINRKSHASIKAYFSLYDDFLFPLHSTIVG